MGGRWRAWVGGACVFCLACAGCVQMPFYVPELNVVPGARSGCDAREVHAFRVDIAEHQELKEGPPPNFHVRGENFADCELRRIAVSAAGTVPRQTDLSCKHGWCYVGFFNNITSYTGHRVVVRLYRPGYETVELKAGESADAVQWREADDLAAQERAIDDLLGVSPLAKVDAKSSEQQRRLVPGKTSAAHRNVLLFCAREYERLAGGAVPDETADRLAEKAQRLRALADGKKAPER